MDWLTPNDYAGIWHVTPGVVTRHCREGNITAKRVGRNWIIAPGQDMPHAKRIYRDEMTPQMLEERAQRHRQQCKANTDWYKSQGICPRCRKRFARPGGVNCEQCNAERRVKLWRGITHQTNAERCRERRELLKARGMCERCGRVKAVPGHVLCKACAIKNAEAQQVRKIRQKIQKEIANGNGNNP